MAIEDLSVVAPAYNEAAGISAVVEDWLRYLASRFPAANREVVVCNDGSRDETGTILDELATRHPELKVVHHPKNVGAAAAVATAIRHSTKRWVLLVDSDGQFPVRNLEHFERAFEDHVVAYLGVRASKQDGAFARVGSWASGQLCNIVHGSHVSDFNSAQKLIRGDIVRSIHLEARGLNYSTEMTSKLLERGIVPKEVAIDHCPRETGVSSMRVVRGAVDRALFVSYLGFRQLLLRRHVLRQTDTAEGNN